MSRKRKEASGEKPGDAKTPSENAAKRSCDSVPVYAKEIKNAIAMLVVNAEKI
jgi:hypothetical protein